MARRTVNRLPLCMCDDGVFDAMAIGRTIRQTVLVRAMMLYVRLVPSDGVNIRCKPGNQCMHSNRIVYAIRCQVYRRLCRNWVGWLRGEKWNCFEEGVLAGPGWSQSWMLVQGPREFFPTKLPCTHSSYGLFNPEPLQFPIPLNFFARNGIP